MLLSGRDVLLLAGNVDEEGFVDGTGDEARFNQPRGIAIDTDGSLFICDTWNHAIRHVTPQGVVTTLAGSGEAGYRDAPGVAARFHGPYGIALDVQTGTLYVSDLYNHCIRQLALRTSRLGSVSVTTLTGTPGTPGFSDGFIGQARFDLPHGITLWQGQQEEAGRKHRRVGDAEPQARADPDKCILVADYRNHCIRRIEVASGGCGVTDNGHGLLHGFVSTLAGGGAPGCKDGSSDEARCSLLVLARRTCFSPCARAFIFA